nr:MAG TPA: Intron-binding protein aquarius N-terminus [Caudoviricetes sp.]
MIQDLYIDSIDRYSRREEATLDLYSESDFALEIYEGKLAMFQLKDLVDRYSDINLYSESVGGIFVAIASFIKSAVVFIMKLFLSTKGVILILVGAVIAFLLGKVKKSMVMSTGSGGGGGGGGSSSSSSNPDFNVVDYINECLANDESPSKKVKYSDILKQNPLFLPDDKDLNKFGEAITKIESLVSKKAPAGEVTSVSLVGDVIAHYGEFMGSTVALQAYATTLLDDISNKKTYAKDMYAKVHEALLEMSPEFRKVVDFHKGYVQNKVDIEMTGYSVKNQDKKYIDAETSSKMIFDAVADTIKGDYGIKSLDALKDLAEIYDLKFMPISDVKTAKIKLNGYLFFKEGGCTVLTDMRFGSDDQLIFNAMVCERIMDRFEGQAHEYKYMQKSVTQLGDVSKLISRAIEEDLRNDLDDTMKSYIPFLKNSMEYAINSMRFLNCCLEIASKCFMNMKNPIASLLTDDIIYVLKLNKIDPEATSLNKGKGTLEEFQNKLLLD